MYRTLFDYGIPLVMAIIFNYFLWGWILMTVKPPKEKQDERTGVKRYPRWDPLETGPQAIQKRVQEVEQKRKAA